MNFTLSCIVFLKIFCVLTVNVPLVKHNVVYRFCFHFLYCIIIRLIGKYIPVIFSFVPKLMPIRQTSISIQQL